MLRTAWALLRLSLLEMTAYRTNLIIWSIIDAIFPLAMIFVWLTIYHGQATVGGLTQSQMLTYYIGVLLVTTTVSVHHEWDIERNIRSGNIKSYLAKPLPFWLTMVTQTLSWRLNASIVNIPVAVGLIWLINHFLHLSSPYPFSWQFGLALLGSLGIFMSMSFVLGYLAFFLDRVSGIIHANDAVRAFASGFFLPLSLFPDWGQSLMRLLPYHFEFDFPIRVLIGTVGGIEFWLGLLTQFLWAALLTLIAIGMWEIGLRRYDAPEQVGVAGVEA
ncbi:ABC-2 family transporter protein [Candidatus Berkelbacteria bacterium]|nr:ABC-2 family transporter protein [Candidatus Berkelbacteria bacterium]